MYNLPGRPELSILYAPPIQAMAGDADGVMQVVELFAVEPYGLLRAPAETLRPRRETKRDTLMPVSLFDDDFDLLIFTR